MIPAKGVDAMVVVVLACAPAPALAQQVDFEIPAQPAVTGIPEFARQARVQIISPVSQLGAQRTGAVRGRLRVERALAMLLRGTGLRVVRRSGNVISLGFAPRTKRLSSPTRVRANPRLTPAIKVDAAPPVPAEPPIVVTGTRIARPELVSAMPVSVVDIARAKGFGRNTIYEALTQNPAIGPGLGNSNTQGEAWDIGVSNINLRSMGVNRSLVLVDGRRWVSGGARTSAVDLNSIPDALIDRIEIVTGGAAAIYGADAVTGAVNIVMRKHVTGFHLSATNGISQSGDARQTNISATTGFRFGEGRGAFVIGATYNDTSPLGYRDRYANRIGFVPNPASAGPDDGVPDNILDDDMRYLHRSSVPAFSHEGQWYSLDNGVLRRTDYDRAYTANPLSGGHGGAGATGFENHFLRNKLALGSVYSQLGYEFGPIHWNTSFSYAHSYARAPSVFPEVRDDLRPANWWGGTTGEIATPTNPFLPDALRDFMAMNGLSAIPLNRTYANLPRPFETHRRDYVTLGTDLGGVLTDRLKWSAFAQYGRVIDQVTTTNMVRHTRWLAAREAVVDPATGLPVCAGAVARATGCVPFDIFTTRTPGQTFLDYVLADRHETRRNRLYSAGGAIQGRVLALPYGDIAIAAGLEWRRELLSTRDDPDSAKLSDIVFKPGVDYVLHPALDAARNTLEYYGEGVVPLLRDLPFARRLELEGAYRYARYSDEPSTNTWKIGGTWEPVAGLTVRGVYSHSVRIPNFGELYSPELVQTVGITSDPCSGAFINQGPNRARNCAALLPGITLPLPYPNTNAPTIYLGGNEALTPETSNSFTLGAVLQPRFARGFDLTIDYWDIRIDNVITAIPYLNILNLCADSSTGIDNFYCGLIERSANGQIIAISAKNYNLAAQRARGIDIGAELRRPIGPALLRLHLNGTYLLEQTNIGSPNTHAIDYAGQWNYPKVRAVLTSEYSVGRLTLGLNTRLIGRSRFDVTDPSPETRDPNHVPAYFYNDVIVRLRANDRFSLTLGVMNVGNAGIYGPLQNTAPNPNSSGGVQTGAAYYDPVGRYAFAKVDLHF